jgi:hypothetical protein
MPRLGATLAFAILLVPRFVEGQPASGEADPGLWRFVHPNAKAVISINWQRIRQSPDGAMIREKLNGSIPAAIPGLEFMDKIDRVVISSPGNAAVPDAGTDTPAEPADTPLLAVVRGHFDESRVRQLFVHLGGKPQAYNSFRVYRPQGKDAKNLACVLFDANTIMFGDAPSVFAALDRNQFAPPAPEPGSILARVAEMDAAYDLSWVMNAPEMLSNSRLMDQLRVGEWAPDAQGLEMGINLRSGLTADITVRFASEVVAKRVVTEMTRLAAVVAKDKADPQVRDIAKKLKLSSDGSAAKISLRLTLPELEKSTLVFAAAHPAAANSEKAAVPFAPVPSAPVKPGVIRIEGLDDGPREIPLPDHQN